MNNNIRIAFYINSLEYGGAERVLSFIANKFSERGYTIDFITSYPSENEYTLNSAINRFYLDNTISETSKIIKNIKQIKKIRKILKDNKVDFLVTFLAEPNIRGILSTLFLNTKSIVSVRNDPHKEYPNKFIFLFVQILYLFSNGCVFQTQEALACFNKFVRKKSTIILNPVDNKFFCKERKYDNLQNIVTIGRLESQKNQELLIKAFSKIAMNYPKEKLLIYGQGKNKEILQSLIERLNMKERIVLMGITDNVVEVLRNARIFVLSSDYEGLPNALMEAIAMEVPVISTDCPCGGPKMLIKDGENGYLVPVNDIDQLKNKMDILLKDINRQIKFSMMNANIRKMFSQKLIIDKWENFILSRR